MRVAIVFLIAGWLNGQSPERPKPAAAPPGNIENGKKIFSSYGCYECHGYAGQGGIAGPRIAPHPIAFAGFNAYIRHPSGQMPPYTRKVVADQEVADIYAFLASLPPPPSVKSIPLLNK
jgi:mono/diheme cytochrome c family protein